MKYSPIIISAGHPVEDDVEDRDSVKDQIETLSGPRSRSEPTSVNKATGQTKTLIDTSSSRWESSLPKRNTPRPDRGECRRNPGPSISSIWGFVCMRQHIGTRIVFILSDKNLNIG